MHQVLGKNNPTEKRTTHTKKHASTFSKRLPSPLSLTNDTLKLEGLGKRVSVYATVPLDLIIRRQDVYC